jgi:hypothetical protein
MNSSYEEELDTPEENLDAKRDYHKSLRTRT